MADYTVEINSSLRIPDEKSCVYVFDFVFTGMPCKPKSLISHLYVNLNGYVSDIIDNISIKLNGMEFCGINGDFTEVPVYFTVVGNYEHVQFFIKINQPNETLDMRLGFSVSRS